MKLCLWCHESEATEFVYCGPCHRYLARTGALPSDKVLRERFGWPVEECLDAECVEARKQNSDYCSTHASEHRREQMAINRRNYKRRKAGLA